MSQLLGLFLAKSTLEAAEKYLDNPSHALLIVGSKGNGIEQVVTALAAERLGIKTTTLTNTPRALIIRPNTSGNISIDEIRNAWSFAKVSGSKGADKSKLVVIYDAQSMTTEAQNSLLKLLEEPPAYLSFILGVPSTRSILPTIDSRTNKLSILGLSETEFQSALKKNGVKSQDSHNLWLISSGEIYKALALNELEAGEGLKFSKELLAKTPYERLVEAKEAMANRVKAKEIATDLYHLAFIGMKSSIGAGKDGKAWLKILNYAEKTISNLEANGNVRLNLTQLLVNI